MPSNEELRKDILRLQLLVVQLQERIERLEAKDKETEKEVDVVTLNRFCQTLAICCDSVEEIAGKVWARAKLAWPSCKGL